MPMLVSNIFTTLENISTVHNKLPMRKSFCDLFPLNTGWDFIF